MASRRCWSAAGIGRAGFSANANPALTSNSETIETKPRRIMRPPMAPQHISRPAFGYRGDMIATRLARAEDEARLLVLLGQLFERDLSQDRARGAAFRRMLGSERGFVIVVE